MHRAVETPQVVSLVLVLVLLVALVIVIAPLVLLVLLPLSSGVAFCDVAILVVMDQVAPSAQSLALRFGL